MDNSSTCKLPRFTVFEFTDKSLAVGESEWICDVDELTADSFDTEATIEVMWPDNASSIVRHKLGKGKKPSLKEPIKTHEATALFFTENLDEANLKCREFTTDVVGVTDGNKRIARKRRFSASEEEADVDLDKNEDKKRNAQIVQSEKMAAKTIADMLESKRKDNVVKDPTVKKKEQKCRERQDDTYFHQVQSSAVTMQNNQDDDKIITVLSGIAQSLDRIESLLRDKKACSEIRYPDMRSQTPSSARTGGQTWSSRMSEHSSPSLSTLHSPSTAPSTPKSIHTTTDIPVPNEGNSDMVVLKGNVRIARGMLNRCEDVDPKRFVSKLLIAMWGRDYLATHSMTGHSKSAAGGSEKEMLDQEVLIAIEEYTLKKFCGFSIQDFRAAVRGKLNSEDKMYKIRQQPKI